MIRPLLIRVAGCLVAALVAAAMLAPLASATPVLDQADSAELAQALAEATETQDVCYGWTVNLRDDSGGQSGDDVGSNRGPDVPLDRVGCERWVLLEGAIRYTAATSEFEDDSAVRISSNLSPAPTENDLRELGVTGSLTDEDNDVVLTNMVEALPLVVAGNGQAPYVEFETAQAPTAEGRPTDSPGSDVVRQWWPLIVLSVLALLAGVVMLVGGLLAVFVRRRRTARPEPRQGT